MPNQNLSDFLCSLLCLLLHTSSHVTALLEVAVPEDPTIAKDLTIAEDPIESRWNLWCDRVCCNRDTHDLDFLLCHSPLLNHCLLWELCECVMVSCFS
jgi:hypothetical protein